MSSSNGLEGMVAKLRGARDFRRNSLPPSMRLNALRPAESKSLEYEEKEVVVERETAL